MLDFVNDPAEVLAAFKTYHTTAELEDVTDPNLVFNLRSKLDAAGHYDDFEVNRVVEVGTETGCPAKRPGRGDCAGAGSIDEAIQGRSGSAESSTRQR